MSSICLSFLKEFSPDTLLKRACGLLHKLSYLDDLYSLGQTENWALEKIKEHIPLLCEWAKKFVAPFPRPDFGTMDFKTPDNPQDAEQPSVCVSALKDIEENIWSPRFGLKGMQVFVTLCQIVNSVLCSYANALPCKFPPCPFLENPSLLQCSIHVICWVKSGRNNIAILYG